ncbi:MAG: long-chain fatty acid--CoA ligase, partial [Verrucomicrobia bacterium]|nr:long-chain fatty acid--CoA ligase [Verrucomicrobiota bacterium]
MNDVLPTPGETVEQPMSVGSLLREVRADLRPLPRLGMVFMKAENSATLRPAMTLNDSLDQQAARVPHERALVDDREEITWAEFAHRVRQCAAALEALELKPGERIGIHALNSIELAVTILTCWRVGLVTVLLSPASKGPELAQELSASGAVAYLGDADL